LTSVVQAAKKGDSNKAAKARQKQQQAEAEQAAQHEADLAEAMLRDGSSSDEEYDEDAMAADAAEAEYGSRGCGHSCPMYSAMHDDQREQTR
jgi:hypothetical protein